MPASILGKRKKEEYYLQRFLANPETRLVVTNIRSVDKDPPDLSMTVWHQLEQRMVSVEVTQIIHPEFKQLEEEQKNIVEGARQMFTSRYNVELNVLVEFSDIGLTITKQNKRLLSEFLFQFAAKVYEANQNLSFRIETKDYPGPHPQFRRIIISNEYSDFKQWEIIGAYVVQSFPEEQFLKRLQRKEAGLGDYRDSYDENWLLMVTNFGHESSGFHFHHLGVPFDQSPFDRIYLYKYFQEEVFRLK